MWLYVDVWYAAIKICLRAMKTETIYTHQSYFGAAGPALLFSVACFFPGMFQESQVLEAYEFREANKKQYSSKLRHLAAPNTFTVLLCNSWGDDPHIQIVKNHKTSHHII